MTHRPPVRRFDPALIHHRAPGVLGELEQLSSRALNLARQMEQRLRAVFPPLTRAERAALVATVVTIRRTT